MHMHNRLRRVSDASQACTELAVEFMTFKFLYSLGFTYDVSWDDGSLTRQRQLRAPGSKDQDSLEVYERTCITQKGQADVVHTCDNALRQRIATTHCDNAGAQQ